MLILTWRPGLARRRDPAEHLVEIAPAGDRPEPLAGPCVSSDTLIRRTPCRNSSAGIAGELAAIGGERQLLERARAQMPRQRLDQAHDVPPYQRLAAGEPELPHPAADEGGGDPVDLLEGQDLLFRQKGHVFRHAVNAAEIAAVGHRDPEIGDLAAERIDQLRDRSGLREPDRLHQRIVHAVNFSTLAACVKCRSSPRARHGTVSLMELPHPVRPALRRTVLSLGLCLGIGALPAVAAAGETLGDALKVNVILTRAEDFAAFTAWSGPRWRSGAAAVYPNRRLFPEHPQARDLSEQGPSGYRYLPTIDAGGGVRWDPTSTAELSEYLSQLIRLRPRVWSTLGTPHCP